MCLFVFVYKCQCVSLRVDVRVSVRVCMCVYLDALVDVPVLQLHEARGDGRDVRLLVGERHATRALQDTT